MKERSWEKLKSFNYFFLGFHSFNEHLLSAYHIPGPVNKQVIKLKVFSSDADKFPEEKWMNKKGGM